MEKALFEKYAKQIATIGANIQAGQQVRIYADVEISDFVSLVMIECYKAGASEVFVEWDCQATKRIKLDMQEVESLSHMKKWEKEKWQEITETLPCRIYILSEDPDGLNGIDPEKMQKVFSSLIKERKPYRDKIELKHQWTIAAAPGKKWAQKVFPNDGDNAVEKLWKYILESVYIFDDKEEFEWNNHVKNIQKNCKSLNDMRFDYLEYKSSNGTDFRVSLMPESLWCGGQDKTLSGVAYSANMPSEEIFTTPCRGKAEGRVVSTKPLSYQGRLVEDFYIDFKDGKAINWDAKSGKEILDEIINCDETSGYIGELALVPYDSPISKSNILYYETLFDENASCHIALGQGFMECVEGFETLGKEGCEKKGMNDSSIHVDFMIGAKDMSITGYKDGKAFPIFINGNWA